MSLSDVLGVAKKLENTVFLPKIDKYLDSINEEELKDLESRRYDTGLHPSQISGCIRRAVYQYISTEIVVTSDNKPLRIPAKSRRIFNNGTYMHERMQKYFQNMGVLLGNWYCKTCESITPQREMEEQLPKNQGKKYGDKDWVKYNKSPEFDIFKLLKPCPKKCPYCGGSRFDYAEVPIYIVELGVEGKTDGIAYIGKDYQKDLAEFNFDDFYILEFKSENSFKFSKHTTAHAQHISQASIYSYGTGFRIDKLSIIYEDKNTQDIKEFIVKVDSNIQNETKRKIEAIRTAIANKELPTEKDTKDCTYCPYKLICDGNTTYEQIELRVANIKKGVTEKDAVDSPYEEVNWSI